MEDNKDFESDEPPVVAPRPLHERLHEPRVSLVLLTQLGFWFGGLLLGALLFRLLAMLAGWDMDLLSGDFSADATPAQLWQMRLLLGLNHLTSFLLAGFATVWLFYGRSRFAGTDWRDYLGARHMPGVGVLGLAVLLILVAMPLVLFSYNLNKLVPLPEIFHLMEDQTEQALKALLRMNDLRELLANLVLLALLPALGEELIFRGVLQRQLMRRIASPWAVILLSAAIFSFIHFQFEGFLPRWLLGILLGWLYWRTNNFWVPVAAHFANNAFQVVGQYLYGQKLSTIDMEQDVQVPWLAAVISALLVLALMRVIEKRVAPPTENPTIP